MEKKTKKKHPIRTIIIILIVIFVLWLLFSDDEEVVEEVPAAAETTVSTQTPAAVETADETAASSTETGTDLEAAAGDAIRDPLVELKGDGKDTTTILIYMNGSDLESENGAATLDLTEMIKAGKSANVNLIVQTMGTKSWSSEYGIRSNRSQIYSVDSSGLTLVRDDLGQLDCTRQETLSDFIEWGADSYPADRYFLILWDHGGGSVYGFGYDEYQDEEDALTMDEIQGALKSSGVYFDTIGMDACIMSSLEVACALYEYCDYTILSEDFESGIGWYYTTWLKALYKDPSIDSKELGTIIVDSMIEANESDSDGDDGILAVIDESRMKVLYTAWTNFAYANEEILLGTNYSRPIRSRGRLLPALAKHNEERRSHDGTTRFFSDWLFDEDDDYSLSDYYITDIMSVASTLDGSEAKALEAAVNETLVYVRATDGDSGLTGISVTLPYGDSEFYSSLKQVYTACGIDSDYVTWLRKFTYSDGVEEYYDYEEWDEEWEGWDEYDEEFDWIDWFFDFDDDFWDDDEEWEW